MTIANLANKLAPMFSSLALPVLTPPLAALLVAIMVYLNEHFTDYTRASWDAEYDYIVVGAGSAGSVVAARLSEDPKMKVLLLEAGDKGDLLSDVPLLAAMLQKTAMDWQYQTEPQRNACFSMRDQRSAWARGKALGGSSSINWMLYVRGNKRDYDKWAREGATGWSWDQVRPYFLKAEDQQDPALVANGHHSTGGPLTVSSPEIQSPLSRAFLESGRHMGYPIGDYNGAVQGVFSHPQGTIREGRRCSTAKAYLKPASSRPNFHIVINALATKILFSEPRGGENERDRERDRDPKDQDKDEDEKYKDKDKDGEQEQDEKRDDAKGGERRGRSGDRLPEARAVQFLRDGALHEVRARREIIISGGAINSPQLLMLSGIGPAEHLRELGIPLVADLPVGQNLQDHIWSAIFFTANKGTSHRPETLFSVPAMNEFLVKKKGPLSSLGGVEGFGFVKTEYANKSDDWPDFQLHMTTLSPSTLGDLFKVIQDLKDDFHEKFLQPFADKISIFLMPILQRPKSRGFIKLRSRDPTADPIIDPKYLSHPDDLRLMVAGMRKCLEIGQQPPLRRLGLTPFTAPVPGCEQHTPLYSDDYLACAARHYTATLWHFSGTCRMGALEDPRTVVDSHLRVKGVRRLRVADASIMPTIVSGNTNAPCIMIGEGAADMIKSAALRAVAAGA